MSTQEFNSLVLSNADGLKPFAITLTKDHETAKDLCQETLCKAFTYRDKYEPGTNIRAWLFTIMRNIFINDYRRSNRKKQVMDAVKQSISPYASSAEMSARLKEINTAIYHLPAIFKKACLLYLHGYKYHEIALALNEPLGTIKSRIHFAKKLLQKQIER
ncbi:MAG: RNA polymerase sigma factor [Gammaproteobacteria bacterium]|nr:MAG: RNA polymerase sigma factor [Gammaproteobacteria bacterium]